MRGGRSRIQRANFCRSHSFFRRSSSTSLEIGPWRPPLTSGREGRAWLAEAVEATTNEATSAMRSMRRRIGVRSPNWRVGRDACRRDHGGRRQLTPERDRLRTPLIWRSLPFTRTCHTAVTTGTLATENAADARCEPVDGSPIMCTGFFPFGSRPRSHLDIHTLEPDSPPPPPLHT